MRVLSFSTFFSLVLQSIILIIIFATQKIIMIAAICFIGKLYAKILLAYLYNKNNIYIYLKYHKTIQQFKLHKILLIPCILMIQKIFIWRMHTHTQKKRITKLLLNKRRPNRCTRLNFPNKMLKKNRFSFLHTCNWEMIYFKYD